MVTMARGGEGFRVYRGWDGGWSGVAIGMALVWRDVRHAYVICLRFSVLTASMR